MQTVSETAQKRVKILEFWNRHSWAATMEAFGVRRRTLFHWKAAYKQSQGKMHALDERAAAFYPTYGFQRSPTAQLMLMLRIQV